MKRKKKKPSSDELLANHIIELMEILKDLKTTNRAISTNMMNMFVEILSDSPTFYKWISNPKSDLSKIEPIIKMMIKHKKK